MVSSGTVNADASSLQSVLDSVSSTVSGISDWTGASHDGIMSKIEQFVSSSSSTIKSQMSSFASACDLYVQYEATKNALSAARSNYNSSTDSNKDLSKVNELNTKLNDLKTQIESLLASIGGSIEASSSSSTTTETSSANNYFESVFTSGKSLGVAAGTYEYTFTSSAGKQMKYYAYIPNNATEGMPLILYLHGDGSVNNMKALKTGEMTRFVSKIYGQDFPFIYIQPMTETTSWTKDGRVDTVAELTQEVAKTYKCDTNRIVLTGHSRGGNGSWSVANKYANMFSCFVPISGRDNDVNPSNLTGLPIVAVSSPDSSDSWNFNAMKNAVNKINAAGGNATFISKTGTNHSSVCKATYTDEFFRWMIAQKRETNTQTS